MNSLVTPKEITIRTELKEGDIGYVTYLHGILYKKQYNYGIGFESYVAAGLSEFYQHYDPLKDRSWICEHHDTIVGFLLLMHRENHVAQLRYFILKPKYRGIGLGRILLTLYMEFLKQSHYSSSYLWTTCELAAAAHLYKQFGFRLTREKASTVFGKPLMEQRYDLIL